MQTENEQVSGLRIGPNGEVELLTRAQTDALIRRAIYEAMVNAGFRGKRLERTLH